MIVSKAKTGNTCRRKLDSRETRDKTKKKGGRGEGKKEKERKGHNNHVKLGIKINTTRGFTSRNRDLEDSSIVQVVVKVVVKAVVEVVIVVMVVA